MDGRTSQWRWIGLCVAASCLGCHGKQYARVIQPGEKQMVGSHQAGQETFKPLVEESVSKLLGRHSAHIAPAACDENGRPLAPPRATIFFVGVENLSSEEIGDFKAQLYEMIDAQISESEVFIPLNRRYVDAGLKELRLRPDELFIPGRLESFMEVMQRQGQPVQYLLYAKLTSGSTRENKDYQRDYLLTLELVDIATGQQDKQAATISKGYHHTWTSRARSKWLNW